MSNKIYVIGHVNPDTDTIASAIGYAWLLRQRDNLETVAARAGEPDPDVQAVREFHRHLMAVIFPCISHRLTPAATF